MSSSAGLDVSLEVRLCDCFCVCGGKGGEVGGVLVRIGLWGYPWGIFVGGGGWMCVRWVKLWKLRVCLAFFVCFCFRCVCRCVYVCARVCSLSCVRPYHNNTLNRKGGGESEEVNEPRPCLAVGGSAVTLVCLC